MKIGILQTGRSPDSLQTQFGDYNEMFQRFLGGRGFEFETYAVLDGDLPDNVIDAEGWLITGSRFGVYEDHEWIAPLENFIRNAYAAAIPIVGVCFGHQIIAQALGGKVEKFSGGWSVGLNEYSLDGIGDNARILAWHQDQVVELPTDATVVGSSPFCKYAALAYGDLAYSIQPHPEFTPGFVTELIKVRRSTLPNQTADQAEKSLFRETTSNDVANYITQFFKRNR